MKRHLFTATLASAIAACGSTAMQDPGVQELRAASQAVEAAATAYQAGTAEMPDTVACTAGHTAYDAEVRPMLQRMRELAAAMDGHMAEMGRPDHADMACAAREMMDELDRHAAAACASPVDMGPNVAEVGAHAGVMVGWATHEQTRCDEVDSMMGGGGGMGGGGMGGGGMMDPGSTLTCPPAP